MFATETSHFRGSGWADCANRMDEVIVFNRQSAEACRASGVTVPVGVVPHAVDLSRFQKSYPPLEQLKPYREAGDFLFYFVGEFVRRKNLSSLVKAFHLEFDPSEPVQLVIKTSSPGVSPDACHAKVDEMCRHVKENLRLYPTLDHYKSELIITERLSQEGLMRLHSGCDCNVTPSFGEAWCAVPGTQVDTRDGPKTVEKVEEGDWVVTHLGRLRRVTRSLVRKHQGGVIAIRPRGIGFPLVFTADHRHFIAKRPTVRVELNTRLHPEFVRAGEVKVGDFWVVPKLEPYSETVDSLGISDLIAVHHDESAQISCGNSYPQRPRHSLASVAAQFGCSFQFVSKVLHGKSGKTELTKRIKEYLSENNVATPCAKTIPNLIRLTPEVMFFFGHYIAEGWATKSGCSLATHINEGWGRELSSVGIWQAFGLQTTSWKPPGRKNSVNLQFNNAVVARFLRVACGSSASEKFIHPLLKRSRNVNHLIRGYFYGDGHWAAGRPEFTTVSERLARDVVEVCNRAGIFVSVELDLRDGKPAGYSLAVPAQFVGRFYEWVNPVKYDGIAPNKKFRPRYYALEDHTAFYLPIESVEQRGYSGEVFNLSVDEDESYTTNGYATHNCIPAFDAMAMGKTPIASNCTAFPDYLSDKEGWLVEVKKEPCFAATDAVPNLYRGDEDWWGVDVNDLRRCMREAFAATRRRKAVAGVVKAYDFSFENVGRTLANILEGCSTNGKEAR
jgi:glycosyltransferase involved in cell wall biosynthesis